jgi:hypothetical protein
VLVSHVTYASVPYIGVAMHDSLSPSVRLRAEERNEALITSKRLRILYVLNEGVRYFVS